MEVIPDFSQVTFSDFAKQHIAPAATIDTHGLKPFGALRAAGYRHVALPQQIRSGGPAGLPASIEPSATCNNG
jgi:hypothetical protein